MPSDPVDFSAGPDITLLKKIGRFVSDPTLKKKPAVSGSNSQEKNRRLDLTIEKHLDPQPWKKEADKIFQQQTYPIKIEVMFKARLFSLFLPHVLGLDGRRMSK